MARILVMAEETDDQELFLVAINHPVCMVSQKVSISVLVLRLCLSKYDT